jgi:hypothetical protein
MSRTGMSIQKQKEINGKVVMPVIPGPWEAKIRRIRVQGHPRQTSVGLVGQTKW